ncbi:MAG: hypothetical protein EP346_09545 [Bacteroidetes bacterium]|nr:MAG: hypothetical protein EP346_09545 [Bacteroidota bacterium]
MKHTILLLALLFSLTSLSQNIERYTTSSAEGILLLPEGEVLGLIIRDFSELPELPVRYTYQFTPLALQDSMAVFVTRTSAYYPDLYLNDDGPKRLDSLLHQVFEKHPEIPSKNTFIGGISASGTRALRYTEYCNSGKSMYGYKMKGCFAVDPPLDLERFFQTCVKILERNHEISNIWECNLITETLLTHLEGTPSDQYDKYVDASVYNYSSPDEPQIAPYLETPIMLIHEPDVEWWVENRMAASAESNMTDVSAFYVALVSQGHSDATLINTRDRGYDVNGNRKPHSWSIVNEPELIDWIKSKL